MVKPPKTLSPHIKTSTTFSTGGAMKKAFVSNWLKSWFSGHVRTHFRYQLGGDVPDLIVAESDNRHENK